ncbi:MAG TPA: CRISPR-associated helicase Cas3' [Oceanobacillus sp.]|nr:CRISPR-associated helicase Cas3' [Oceanobacillus sp.]
MSNLFSHQERVYDLVASGKNVLLQAPTGSGKTRAALYPFIAMFDEPHSPFPKKCIYSVPMRVLAKQFTHEYREILQEYSRRQGLNISVKIQTGEQPEDPEFASNLIFATIDQTLSSFLLNPYGLPKRQANLNAAAVMASYLVFDEFHLFDPTAMLPTTLHMLQLLNGITPFILMTATFSQDMLEGLANLLNAEIVQLSPEELKALPTQNKTRRYHVADQPMTAETVLDKHSTRSLVICNTIDRARRIYEQLCEAKSADTEVLLLHSRFLPEERNRIEGEIRSRFGKDDKTGGSLIAVSTQAIEVGVDITSGCLHTELAPANTIVQRAGRCARYPGDTGDVYIYRHVYNDNEIVDLCENILPYKDQKVEFERTWHEFSERCGTAGEKLEYHDEQQIISAVHGERDKKLIEDLGSTSAAHRRQMFAVMRDGEGATHLIRDAFQQRITISDDPNSLLDSPFDAPAFGVFPFTLERWVENWLEFVNQRDGIPWAVKYLHQPPRGGDADIENLPRYEWIEVQTKETVRGAGLLVVHPLLATYDPKVGFLPDVSTPPEKIQKLREWFQLPVQEKRREGSRFTYRLETYEDHIAQVYRAAFEYGGMWEEMQDIAAHLERQFGWKSGILKQAAQLAVLLHDVGKLSIKWQGWVKAYQQKIRQWDSEKARHAYAHTLLKTDEHRETEKHMPKRPWHAVESSLACVPMLAEVFKDDLWLARVVYSAIARHHAPRSAENQEFQLIPHAKKHVTASLETAVEKLPMTISPEMQRYFANLALDGIDDKIERDADPTRENVVDLNDEPHPDEIHSYFAYWLIVRVLRRADQLGTERGGKGV